MAAEIAILNEKFGYSLEGDRVKGINKLYNPITG